MTAWKGTRGLATRPRKPYLPWRLCGCLVRINNALAVEPTLFNATGLTPIAALANMKSSCSSQEWRQRARISAVLSSCPDSRAALKSGVACWMKHVISQHGPLALVEQAFPPPLNEILVWSHSFACAGTFGNYLSSLRKACQVLDVAGPPPSDPCIRAAMAGVIKRRAHIPREKMFVCRDIVATIVLRSRQGLTDVNFAMLVLFAYTFLLRTPSEVWSVAQHHRIVRG